MGAGVYARLTASLQLRKLDGGAQTSRRLLGKPQPRVVPVGNRTHQRKAEATSVAVTGRIQAHHTGQGGGTPAMCVWGALRVRSEC